MLGSRTADAAVLLWWFLRTIGRDGADALAQQCLDVAAYAEERLRSVGWRVWRNPGAITVVLEPAPPVAVAHRWHLPLSRIPGTTRSASHLVAVPGVTKALVDALVDDLATRDLAVSPATERQPA